jgi:hypothetical protein
LRLVLCPSTSPAPCRDRHQSKRTTGFALQCDFTESWHGDTKRALVATDGSRHAKLAIATTWHFPWPARTGVRATIARSTRVEY